MSSEGASKSKPRVNVFWTISWIALYCAVIIFAIACWSAWNDDSPEGAKAFAPLPPGPRNTRGMHFVDPYVLIKFPTERICDKSMYPASDGLRTDRVTILVNGFSEARIELLQRNMWAYAESPLVDAVYVMWGNLSSPRELVEDHPGWTGPPQGQNSSGGAAGTLAPVQVFRQPSSSLNDRFLPRPFVRTRAVVICDDDITISSELLEFALKVWRENEWRIVGFFPRSHLYDEESKSWLYTKLPDRYSVMLTKFMILHTDFLYEYTCHTPLGVKDFVDSGSNCEDIAMNFVVSQRTLLGPVLVGGNTRDWGDGRNSDPDIAAVGLSARTGHKADRGTCIAEFERLWGGMELRYSYAKAMPDIEELAMCEKFGFIVNCDARVRTRLQAQREVGLHVVKLEQRYAYATLLVNVELLPAAVALAQSLRLSGTVHDIVLMLDSGVGLEVRTKDKLLVTHFDQIVRMPAIGKHSGVEGFSKLNAWRLEEYSKIIYLDVDMLVLANLDHLFEHPEPTAVPDVYMSGMFNSGLMVLRPSMATFTDMMEKVDLLQTYNKRGQGFLNSYFSGWFQMSPEHRLPARYNADIFFSDRYKPPHWFNASTVYKVIGPIQVVHFAHPWFWPWKQPEAWNVIQTFPGRNRTAELVMLNTTAPLNMWSSLWIALVKELAGNLWKPLGSDFSLVSLLPNAHDYEVFQENRTLALNASTSNSTGVFWDPSGLPASALITAPVEDGNATASWVPAPLHKPFEPAQPPSMGEAAFVTLITNRTFFAAPVWVQSYLQYHAGSARRKTVLLVLSNINEELWKPYRHLFSQVKVLHPISITGLQLHDSFAILHVWQQVEFQKLIYVDPVALFMDNCNDLLRYDAFAAVPSTFPPDMFSSKVMVIQPNMTTYKDMIKKLSILQYPGSSVQLFLNAYYNSWYRSSPLHRISPKSGVDVWFKEGLMELLEPRKILVFDSRRYPGADIPDWKADDRGEAVMQWYKVFCSLEDSMRPSSMGTVCQTQDAVQVSNP